MSGANSLSQAEVFFEFLERFVPFSVIVDGDDNIIHLSEHARQYLQLDGSASTLNLLRIVDPMSRMELGAALSRARQTANQVIVTDMPIIIEGAHHKVDLRLIPAQDLAADLLVVVFGAKREVTPAPTIPAPSLEPFVQHLEQELNHLKAQLRESVNNMSDLVGN